MKIRLTILLLITCILLMAGCNNDPNESKHYKREIDEEIYSYIYGETDLEIRHSSRGVSTDPPMVSEIKLDKYGYLSYIEYWDHPDLEKEITEERLTLLSEDVMVQLVHNLLNVNDFFAMNLDEGANTDHSDGASNTLTVDYNGKNISFGGYGIYLYDEYNSVAKPFFDIIDQYLFSDTYVEVTKTMKMKVEDEEVLRLASEILTRRIKEIYDGYWRLSIDDSFIEECFKDISDYDNSIYDFLEAEQTILLDKLNEFVVLNDYVMDIAIVADDRIIMFNELANPTDYLAQSLDFDYDEMTLSNQPLIRIEDNSFLFIDDIRNGKSGGLYKDGYIVIRYDAQYLLGSFESKNYNYIISDLSGSSFYLDESLVYEETDKLYWYVEHSDEISMATRSIYGFVIEVYEK